MSARHQPVALAARARVTARQATPPAKRPAALPPRGGQQQCRRPTSSPPFLAAWLPGLGRLLVPGRASPPPPPQALAGEGAEEDGVGTHPPPPPPSVATLVRGGAPLGLGFAAGGLLFPYLSGVAFGLAAAGVIDPHVTPMAGASAGALIAACVGSGMDRPTVDAACDALAADCRSCGTRGRLGSVLEDFLEAHLPPDADARLRGRVYVAVTRVGSRRAGGGVGGRAAPAWAGRLLARLPDPAGLLLSDFESRADLISALLTSCHIPLWMDGTLARTFRGEAHVDGGLTQFLPLPPACGGAAIGVCAFPSRRTLLPALGADRLIAPDVYDEDWDVSLPTLLSWALHPAGEAEFSGLSAKGTADALAWAAASGVGEAVAGLRAAKAAAGEAPVLEWPAGPGAVVLPPGGPGIVVGGGD
jgi:hypothetical protein